MDLSESIGKFNSCTHEWKFHIDAGRSGGPAAGNSFFLCSKCGNEITLLEKCTLDQTIAQEKSLKIQERHTWIGMIANIIAAGLLFVAVLTLLFGEKLLGKG